jgi:phenylalanyl-tRNA synthetase beta chain
VDVFDAKADAEAVLAAIGAPGKTQIRATGRPGSIRAGTGGVRAGAEEGAGASSARSIPGCPGRDGRQGPGRRLHVFPADPAAAQGGRDPAALALNDLQVGRARLRLCRRRRVEAAQLVVAAQGADKTLVADVRVFDQFGGEKARRNSGAGKKSVALTVRLQPTEKTLTDAEIEAVAARVIDRVANATGGVLRS